MKKKEKKEEYFSGDIQDSINKMRNPEMNELLLELEGTRYWVAILRYLQLRTSFTQTAVLTMDAVKEAGQLSRNQGIIMGLSDLPNAILELKDRKNREANKKEDGTIEIGEDNEENS